MLGIGPGQLCDWQKPYSLYYCSGLCKEVVFCLFFVICFLPIMALN